MCDFDVGDLIEVIENHRVPTEESAGFTRIYQKGKWPYATSSDLLIPKGLTCLVLEPPSYFDLIDLWFIHVLIVNPTLGFNNFKASINGSRAKLVKKGSGSFKLNLGQR